MFPSPTFLWSARGKPQSLLIRNEKNIYYITSNKTSMSNIITVSQKYGFPCGILYSQPSCIPRQFACTSPPPLIFFAVYARQKLMYIINTDRYNWLA